jgi:hypothetical protein
LIKKVSIKRNFLDNHKLNKPFDSNMLFNSLYKCKMNFDIALDNMYNPYTPMGSSHSQVESGQPPSRKEISWLSEVIGKTIALFAVVF